MTKFISTLCLLFCITQNNIAAQKGADIAPDYTYAQSLFNTGTFDVAAKELLRVYYFDREGEYKRLPLEISKCFDKLAQPEVALKYSAMQLRQNNLDIATQSESYYYNIQLLIKNNLHKQALASLYQIDNKLIDHDKDRYYFYMAMTLLKDNDLEEAKSSISSLSYFTEIDSATLSDLYSKIRKNRNKKHFWAKMWSAILPGLGQTINGNASDGLNSALVNGGLIWLFFEVAKNLSYTDAAISVVPWLTRFYTGGMRNAGAQSQTKQKQKHQEYINSLTELLYKTKS